MRPNTIFPSVITPTPNRIRHRFDVDRIPHVEFRLDSVFGESHEQEQVGQYRIHHQNRAVGDIAITRVNHPSVPHFYTENIRHDGSSNIKGIGLAAYLLAIQHAHTEALPYVVGDPVSQDAKKIWDILTGVGVVDVIEPLSIIGLDDAEPPVVYYAGKLAVHPLHAEVGLDIE